MTNDEALREIKADTHIPMEKRMGRLEEILESMVIEEDRRSFVIKKAPVGTTITSIIEDIQKQMEKLKFTNGHGIEMEKAEEVIEGVFQDILDNRRFTIYFTDYEYKKHIAKQGFYIGRAHIKPCIGDVRGYIPRLTTNERIIREILGLYGTVDEGRMTTYKDTTIRTGGVLLYIAFTATSQITEDTDI